MPNLSDHLRALMDPRPTATARGFHADRVGRSTFHYRPVFPVGRPLDRVHAARLLMSPAVHALTDAQLDQVGRVLGLTATDQVTATARPVDPVGADRDQVADRPTATADRSGDQVTATGRPSATDRATVSVAAGPTATATGPDRSADRVTGPQRGRGAA